MKKIIALILAFALFSIPFTSIAEEDKPFEPFTMTNLPEDPYCQPMILNEGTEFPVEFVGYFLPAGTYKFTNKGEFPTQLTIYINEKQVVDGWEEFKTPEDKHPAILFVDEPQELVIDEGEFIKLADGETKIDVEFIE